MTVEFKTYDKIEFVLAWKQATVVPRVGDKLALQEPTNEGTIIKLAIVKDVVWYNAANVLVLIENTDIQF